MLPFRSGCFGKRGVLAGILALAALSCTALAAESTASPGNTAKKSNSPVGPASIPLPVGHEAKGLVLPDYDLQGRLQAKFEAASAKRTDEVHIQFLGLKMTTFTAKNKPDLLIDMPASTLNLTTRVINSDKRTTVTRADFNIAGDTMRFDTVARQGKLVGNVKMVIRGDSQLMGNAAE